MYFVICDCETDALLLPFLTLSAAVEFAADLNAAPTPEGFESRRCNARVIPSVGITDAD